MVTGITAFNPLTIAFYEAESRTAHCRRDRTWWRIALPRQLPGLSVGLLPDGLDGLCAPYGGDRDHSSEATSHSRRIDGGLDRLFASDPKDQVRIAGLRRLRRPRPPDPGCADSVVQEPGDVDEVVSSAVPGDLRAEQLIGLI